MTPLQTQIRQVAVYPDRARVTRTGSALLDAGSYVLTIAPLPRAIIEDSVRASGKGSARLLGVELVPAFAEQSPNTQAVALQAEVERLQDADQVLADEERAWQQRLAVVQGIGAQGGEDLARNVARGKLSLDQLTILLDYLSQSHEAGAAVLRDLTARRRQLAHEIEAAKQRAAQAQSTAAREWREARISLDTSEPGEVTIELTYAVDGASWESLYDVRLNDKTLQWNYLAQVRQETGEDWNDCELTLSTATLATGLDKPELPPWRIDSYRPPEPRPRASLASSAPVPAMQPFAEDAVMMKTMRYQTAQVESEGPGVTYHIAKPRSIPSDGAPHQVAIAELTFEPALDYFCAPKVDEHTFLRATFRNDSPNVMLAGRAALYHGADFVGERELETIAPQQEVELFLGADERITVERKEVDRTVDKNLLGNTARQQLGYHIAVQNLLGHTANILMLDQIPVSQHPDIKVKLREAIPKPTYQNEQGELGWEFELESGQKYEITFLAAVEYPKEMRVVGL